MMVLVQDSFLCLGITVQTILFKFYISTPESTLQFGFRTTLVATALSAGRPHPQPRGRLLVSGLRVAMGKGQC